MHTSDNEDLRLAERVRELEAQLGKTMWDWHRAYQLQDERVSHFIGESNARLATIHRLNELLAEAENDANYAVDTLDQILKYCNEREHYGKDLNAAYVRGLILARHPVEDEDDD